MRRVRLCHHQGGHLGARLAVTALLRPDGSANWRLGRHDQYCGTARPGHEAISIIDRQAIGSLFCSGRERGADAGAFS